MNVLVAVDGSEYSAAAVAAVANLQWPAGSEIRLLSAAEEFLQLLERADIGAICHAQWVLVSADVLRDRRATSPADIAVDLKNAGAHWVKEEAVRDGHLVTSIYFGCLPAFLRLLIDAIEG